MKIFHQTFSAIMTDRYVDTNPLYHNPITIDGIGYAVDRVLEDITPSRFHICKIGNADVSLTIEDYNDIIWDFDYDKCIADYPPEPNRITFGKPVTATMELTHDSTPWTVGSHHITLHLHNRKGD